jgi:hypothetical protein
VYRAVDYGLSQDEERKLETGFGNLICRMLNSGECQLPNENFLIFLFFPDSFQLNDKIEKGALPVA